MADCSSIVLDTDGPSEIRVQPFSSLQPDALERLTSHRGSLLPASDPRAEQDATLPTEGFLIEVPSGFQTAQPLRLTLTPTAASTATYIVLLVGKGASVTVIEELTGQCSSWSHVVEIFAEDEATAEYVSLQTIDPAAHLSLRQYSRVGNGTRCTWRNATLGAATVEQTTVGRVIGAHATSAIDWMFFARGAERHTLTARNIFDASDGGGEITMRGVAEEKAHVGCRGMIDIGRGGGGTNTYLTQEVLMLDPSAKVDAIPGLEIKTNDVKASHSATVARVTPEDLFYFATRGIAEAEARHLFLHGFLAQMAARVPAARERIEEAIEAKEGRA